MPWLETVLMEERWRFIQDAQRNRFTMTELCARYGISRRVGYKWLARFEAEGRRGIADRSLAPARGRIVYGRKSPSYSALPGWHIPFGVLINCSRCSRRNIGARR